MHRWMWMWGCLFFPLYLLASSHSSPFEEREEISRLRVDDLHFFQSDLADDEESLEKPAFPILRTLFLTGAQQPCPPHSMEGIFAFDLDVPGGFYNLKQQLLPYLEQPFTAEIIEQIQAEILQYYHRFPSYRASVSLLSQELELGTAQFAVQVHLEPLEEPHLPPCIQSLVLLSKGNYPKKKALEIEIVGLDVPAGSYNLIQRLKPYLKEPLTEETLTYLQQEIYAYYALLNAPLHQVYVVEQDPATGRVQIELDTPLSFSCPPIVEAIALLDPAFACPLDGVEGIVIGDIEVPGGSYNLIQKLKSFLEAPYEPAIFCQIQETLRDYYAFFFLNAELTLLPPDPQTGIVCFSLAESPFSASEIEALLERESPSHLSPPQIQAIVLNAADHPCQPSHVEGIVALGLEIPGDFYNLRQRLIPFLQAPFTPEEIEQIQSHIVHYYRSFPDYDASVSLLSQDLQTGVVQFAVQVHSPYPKESIQPTLQSIRLFAKGNSLKKVPLSSFEIRGLEIPAGSYNLELRLKPYFQSPLTEELLDQIQREIVSYYAALNAPLQAIRIAAQDKEKGFVQIELETPLSFHCPPLLQAIVLMNPSASCHFEEVEGIVPVDIEIPGGSYNLSQRLKGYLDSPYTPDTLQRIQQTLCDYYALFCLQIKISPLQTDPETGIFSVAIESFPFPLEPVPFSYPPLSSIVLTKSNHTCQAPQGPGIFALGLLIPGDFYNLQVRLKPFLHQPMCPETGMQIQDAIESYYRQFAVPLHSITLSTQSLSSAQFCFELETPWTLPCPSQIRSIVLMGEEACCLPEEAEGIFFIDLEVPAGSYNLRQRILPFLQQPMDLETIQRIEKEIRLYYARFTPLRAHVKIQKQDPSRGLLHLLIQVDQTDCRKCTPQKIG